MTVARLPTAPQNSLSKRDRPVAVSCSSTNLWRATISPMRLVNGILGTSWHWLRINPGALPSVIALVAVTGFWVAGLAGGISLLGQHQPPLTILTELYLMLAVAAFSIIIAVLAASDLTSRIASRTRGYRRM